MLHGDLKYVTSPYERQRVALIRGLIPPGNGKKSLDLGCGIGFFSRILKEKGWTVLGIDIDQEAIELAKGTCSRDATISFQVGDVEEFVHSSGDTFDLILCLEVIEHLNGYEKLMADIVRLLAPGGILIVSTPNRWSLEGLVGYYWGEKMRKWDKWNAWDSSHVKIFNSFEFLKLLRSQSLRVNKLLGYWYRARLPLVKVDFSLPFQACSKFPINMFGFNIIVAAEKRRLGL